MKRIALVLLFLFPVLEYSNAQVFQAGFYAGATMTDIPGTDNIDNDADFSHLGFTIGGTVCTKISPSTTLQMEIRLFRKGAQQNPAIDTTPNNSPNPTIGYNNYFTMTLDYVDIVLGIKHAIHFNLHNKATDRYGIEGGVSVGTLIHSSYEVQSVSYPVDVSLIDVSPYIGIYYNVTPHFYIEGRYSNSINSALKHDNTNGNSFYNLYYGTWDAGHNVAFSLTLGFVFGGVDQTQSKSAPTHPAADATDN